MGTCRHCARGDLQDVQQHELRCTKRFGLSYRWAAGVARRKIERLQFDRRTREAAVYEYALVRHYVDGLAILVAVLALAGRAYLAIDFGLPLSGALPPARSDLITAFFGIWQLNAAVTARKDYRRNVVRRIERSANSAARPSVAG